MGRGHASATRLALLVGLFLLAWPWPAEATESGTIEAFTWAPVAPASPAALPGSGPTSAASDGTIFVTAVAGSEGARSYLALGHGDPTAIQSIVLHLPESSQSVDADQAVVQACPSESLARTDDPEAADPPAVDCSTKSSVGVRSDDGTWAFDLTPFVAVWPSDAVHTVALVSVPPDPTSSYSVAYRPEDGKVEIERASVPVAAGSVETSLTPVAVARFPTAIDRPAPTAPVVPSVVSPLARNSNPTGTQPSVTPLPASAPPLVESVNSPPTAVVMLIVLVLAAGVLARRGWRPAVARDGQLEPGARLGLSLAGGMLLLLAPVMFSEVTVFELGLLLIFFTAVLGLHVLVNWAGELSLAHAGLVGLPAFVVAKLGADHGWSPILLVPLGVVVGVVAGTVIALPALRTSGLYVAVTTLAAGIAIDRFFFTRDWLTTAGGNAAPPSLFGISFTTTNSLYPVIVVLTGLALAAALVLYRSKTARGMLWMRVDRTAAAAFGVSVDRQRVLAFAVAGAYAGLAGGMTFLWTSLATPSMFPLTLSLSYVAAVVVAGPGGAGGLAVAAALLEGGRLFVPGSEGVSLYAGPIALMLVLTRFPSGINGLGRFLMKALTNDAAARATTSPTTNGAGRPPTRQFTPSFVAGVLSMVAGFTSIVVAWYHTGNTDELWIQTQEILLGGVGGLGLIVLGATLLLRDALLNAARSGPDPADRKPNDVAALPDGRSLRTEPSRPHRRKTPA